MYSGYCKNKGIGLAVPILFHTCFNLDPFLIFASLVMHVWVSNVKRDSIVDTELVMRNVTTMMNLVAVVWNSQLLSVCSSYLKTADERNAALMCMLKHDQSPLLKSGTRSEIKRTLKFSLIISEVLSIRHIWWW